MKSRWPFALQSELSELCVFPHEMYCLDLVEALLQFAYIPARWEFLGGVLSLRCFK